MIDKSFMIRMRRRWESMLLRLLRYVRPDIANRQLAAQWARNVYFKYKQKWIRTHKNPSEKQIIDFRMSFDNDLRTVMWIMDSFMTTPMDKIDVGFLEDLLAEFDTEDPEDIVLTDPIQILEPYWRAELEEIA